MDNESMPGALGSNAGLGPQSRSVLMGPLAYGTCQSLEMHVARLEAAIRDVLQWEAKRMGAVSAAALRDVLRATGVTMSTDQAPNACGDGNCLEAIETRIGHERDCRTCKHWTPHHRSDVMHCSAALRCVAGSSYQRHGVVQLWEAAPGSEAKGHNE